MAKSQEKYTDELADEICRRIANGEFLRAICREPGKPNWCTIYEWIKSKPDFAQRMEEARSMGADAIAEDALMMLDEPPERCMTMSGDKVDAGHVQWQKNRSEQRLKVLAKWHPKKYGDKVAVTDGDGKPLQGAQVVPVFNVTVKEGK